jgi:hypothetical protein
MEFGSETGKVEFLFGGPDCRSTALTAADDNSVTTPALTPIKASGLMKLMRFGGLISKQWPVACGAFLLATVLGLLWWSPWEPREPVYDGKPLTYWLSRIAEPHTPQSFLKDTNAIPFLVKALERDTWIGGAIYRKQVWPKLPPMFQKHLPPPANAAAARTMAAVCLRKMGPLAAPAIPALIRVLKEDEDSGARFNALWALAAIGNGDSTAISALAEALKDRDQSVRHAALTTLQIAAAASPRGITNGIPESVQTLLQDTDGTRVYLARRDADRNLVAIETLDESVLNLITNDQQFITVAMGAGTGELPILLRVTRALKVIQTIEALPASEQESACRAFFTRALAAHTNQLTRPVHSTGGPAWQSLVSTRLSLFAAMFTTADLGLRGLLHEEFVQVGSVRSIMHSISELNLLRLVVSHDRAPGTNLLAVLEESLKTDAARTVSTKLRMTNWVDRVQALARVTGQPPPQVKMGNSNSVNLARDCDLLAWKGYETYDEDAAQKKQAQEDLVLELRRAVLGLSREQGVLQLERPRQPVPTPGPTAAGGARWTPNAPDLDSLRRETLHESILDLITNALQYVGGYERFGAQIQLETMLASRRALKVIQDIEALPAAQQRQACEEFFKTVFQEQTNALSIFVRWWEEPSRATNVIPRLDSRLMATCVATFTAADLGLRDLLSDELAQLDRFGDDVVNPFCLRHAAEDTDKRLAAEMRRYAQPDNRFQLNLLRLAALRDTNDRGKLLALLDEELRSNQLRTTNSVIPITAWDAPTTRFEEWRLAGTGKKMEEKDVIRRYDFLDWDPPGPHSDADRETQRELVRKLRLLVLGTQR